MIESSTNTPAQPYYPPNIMSSQENVVSLPELWQGLVKQKFVFFLSIFCCLFIALFIAFSSPRIYKSEVILEAVEKDKVSSLAAQFGGLASLAGVSLSSGSGSASHVINVLSSRTFAKKFIETEEIKKSLFPDRWDDVDKKWKVFSLSWYEELKIKIFPSENKISYSDSKLLLGEPEMMEAIEKFSKILKIDDDRPSGILKVGVEWNDPMKAAIWSNKIVDVLIHDLKTKTIKDSSENIKYLEKEIQKTNNVEMRQMLYGMIKNHSKSKMLATVGDNFAFEILDSAVVSNLPIKPKRKIIVLFGGFLGVILGVFMAFFRNLIKNND
jgi:uncharacterized protein involved in exopolysaccharide biosynthesis